MVDDRVEAGRRALHGFPAPGGLVCGWGVVWPYLQDSMVQSVLLYGAEAWPWGSDALDAWNPWSRSS